MPVSRPEPSRLEFPSFRKIHMNEHQQDPSEAHPAVRRLDEAFAREAIDRICRLHEDLTTYHPVAFHVQSPKSKTEAQN